MLTQRREEKNTPACRVEGREKERERAPFGSSFYVFPSSWACPMQIGLTKSAVVSPEVLRPSFVLLSRAFPFLVF